MFETKVYDPPQGKVICRKLSLLTVTQNGSNFPVLPGQTQQFQNSIYLEIATSISGDNYTKLTPLPFFSCWLHSPLVFWVQSLLESSESQDLALRSIFTGKECDASKGSITWNTIYFTFLKRQVSIPSRSILHDWLQDSFLL